jgi:hypothetical protein
MLCFHRIAEQRILEAVQRGELDDLPGAGRPLELDDDSHVPEDLRMAFRILKNAGCSPPEVELRKEISRVEDLLSGMEDMREKYQQIKKLNFLVMKLNMMRRAHVDLEKCQHYEERLVERFGSNVVSTATRRMNS